jgi:hypothetical protein
MAGVGHFGGTFTWARISGLVKKIEMDEKVGQSNNQWGWNGFQW